MNREELYNNFIQTHNELSHDEIITMIDFIEIVKKQFKFNEETDCKDKYNEIIQDYLYSEIITKLN